MIRGKTVSDILVEYEIILPEEREIVTYGIKQTVISLGHIALFLIIGFGMHMFCETAVFLVTFSTVRRYAGGCHADTRLRCTILSTVFVTINLFLIQNIKMNSIFCIVHLCIMCGMIIWLSPVQNGNNPLNEHEKRAYRCKSAVYSIIGVIRSCLFACMKLPSYRYSINMAMMSVFILQMAGMVKYSQMKGRNGFRF